MSNDKGKKISIFWKIAILPIAVLIVLILTAVVKETHKKNQIQKEIENLRERARQMEKDNSEIQEKISYLESKDYQEREAKNKLNLQNPGENVVILKPGIVKQSPVEKDNTSSVRTEEKELANPAKWWRYFFKN